MPSPIFKLAKGKFYKRKGGAWARRGGVMVHVGTGKGNYSMRDPRQDYQRHARRSGRYRRRYPHHYD